MSRTTKTRRSREDLKRSLIEQVDLLELSCTAYDQGKTNAAKHIAVALRVLLHHTNRSASLLEQLGLRNKRYYQWNIGRTTTNPATMTGKNNDQWKVEFLGPINSSEHTKVTRMRGSTTSSCQLVVQCAGPENAQFVAPLSSFGTGHETRSRFENWWNNEVARDDMGNSFCRRDIILNIADTDGGAHVDPQLENRYLEFSRNNSLDWTFGSNGREWQAIPNPHLACARQIAHELLITLNRYAPWAFIDHPYVFPDPFANLAKEGNYMAVAGFKIVTGNP